MGLNDPERNVPEPQDYDEAEKQWNSKNPFNPWQDLRTQTKNRLAKIEMHHREYAALAAVLMGKGKK